MTNDAQAGEAATSRSGEATDHPEPEAITAEVKVTPEERGSEEKLPNGDASSGKKKKHSKSSSSKSADKDSEEAAGDAASGGGDDSGDIKDLATEEDSVEAVAAAMASETIPAERKKSALTLEEEQAAANKPKEDPTADDPLSDPANYRRYYQAIFTAFKTGEGLQHLPSLPLSPPISR